MANKEAVINELMLMGYEVKPNGTHDGTDVILTTDSGHVYRVIIWKHEFQRSFIVHDVVNAINTQIVKGM